MQESAAGSVWLDASKMNGHTDHLSGGEQRALAIVPALADAGPGTSAASSAGSTATNLTLILAALAHVGGSHEQVDASYTDDGLVFLPLAPIVAWPDGVTPEGWAA